VPVLSPSEVSGLAEGWAAVKLPDVCAINPPKPPADLLPPEAPVTFVPMPAVDADRGWIATPATRPFVEVRRGFTAFRDDDVIMAKITPCMENGKAAIARDLQNGLGFGSTEFHVFRSNGAILPKYLFHYIRQESFRKAAEAEMTGSVGQKRVPVSFLEETDLPLAPLAEQKRIVVKVEELLARVNAARERLARVPAILKRFRQSILAAACSGRLTADWREKHPIGGSADILNERIDRDHVGARSARNTKEKQIGKNEPAEQLFGLPETWAWVTLSQLGQEGRPIIYGIIKPGPHVPDGVPYVRVTEMKDGVIDVHKLRRASQERAAKFARATLVPGDLLISKDGTIGRVAVVPLELAGGNITQHLVRAAIHPSMNRDYVVLAIRSTMIQRWLTAETLGVALQGVNVEDFRRLPIPVPPFDEQAEIVRQVEALLSRIDTIEAHVQASTIRAERMTQAIMARAFRGELVPTEAELARTEGRPYEPASVLLDRIRAGQVPDTSLKSLRSGKAGEHGRRKG
jgi:type I restriction enzyme S subunit